MVEHCRRDNSKVEFTTSNYNILTWPSLEYEFVMSPREVPGLYPHTPSDKSQWSKGEWSSANPCGWKGEHGRDPIRLDAFFPEYRDGLPDADALLQALPDKVRELVRAAWAVIKRAGLLRGEVAGLRLYSGPMFVLYNAVLRGFPERDVSALRGNRYETTIFTITSGITKLSKVSDVPPNRLLFRGLGGMVLPRQFWDVYDECIVSLVIRSHEDKGDVSTILQAVRLLLVKSSAASGAAHAKAYDIDAQLLQLPFTMAHEGLREAAARGIRVASPPREEGGSAGVSLVLAVPEDKFAFEDRLAQPLKQALSDACGGHTVFIVHVAAKPRGFRGGGAPLISDPLSLQAWPHSQRAVEASVRKASVRLRESK